MSVEITEIENMCCKIKPYQVIDQGGYDMKKVLLMIFGKVTSDSTLKMVRVSKWRIRQWISHVGQKPEILAK